MSKIGKIRQYSKSWPQLKLWVGRRIVLKPAEQYAVFACIVLLGTTLGWAIAGAKIHLANADQLVNAYLFENFQTFQGSLLPAQHTFLLKWPLFWLISWLHFATWAFVVVTVLLVLATVAGLAVALRKIERRPLVIGTLLLALASVLLMVPIHPQPGAQLPVNMAMLTTRNVEYVLYMGVLALLITVGRTWLKSWKFWAATALLALLITSDRLFMTLSLGGALLSLAAYACLRQRTMVQLAAQWLLVSVLATVVSFGAVWGLNAAHVVVVTSSTGNAWGSYGLVKSFGSALHGVAYAVLSVLTNFGANPFYDITLKEVPAHILGRLVSVQGLAQIINLAVLGFVCVASAQVLRRSMRQQVRPSVKFAVALLFSAAASMVAFAATDHFYPVDARYEGIVVFAGFVAAATYLSFQRKPFVVRHFGKVTALLLVGVVVSCIGGYQLYAQERDAQASVVERNARVAQTLSARHVNVLVGDYWRVMPIKQAMNDKSVTVIPLSDCTHYRDALSSKNWQGIDLSHTAFAYLLALDKPDPQFPDCTLDQVTRAYGRPNASTVVAGTVSAPEGTLLYYDYGAGHVPLSATPSVKELATVKPIDITDLNKTSPVSSLCSGKMIVNIVAHQDDDLLFMNPDITHELADDKCIRTIYVTAGDDGQGELYWMGRQTGAEHAYNTMLGAPQTIWTHTIVRLADKQFVTLANPIGHPNVALIFLNLPDGNLNGSGFAPTKFESIHKLLSGGIKKIHSIDGQSEYTTEQLVQALATLLQRYDPQALQVQTPDNKSKTFADHSDHLTVGVLGSRAASLYEKDGAKPETKFYVGYPIRARPENVFGADLDKKAAAFFSYADSDSGVCKTMRLCSKGQAYGFYLRRQYSN